MRQPTVNFPFPHIVGTYRTFGLLGPLYQILGIIRQTTNGDWLLRILVVETGEETEYPYIQMQKDPEAS